MTQPTGLEGTVKALQEAASRLLAQGVPLEDVTALAEAVRAHSAQHASEWLNAARMTTASPTYRGGSAALSHVRAAPLPLVADTNQEH